MNVASFAASVKSETKFSEGQGPVGFDVSIIIAIVTALMPLLTKMLENCKKKPEDMPALAKSRGFVHKLKVNRHVKRICKDRGWSDQDHGDITDGLFVAAAKLTKGESRELLAA